MGGTMKELCYPVLDERGLTIVIKRDGQDAIRSEPLPRSTCFRLLEMCLQQIQRSLREDKSQ